MASAHTLSNTRQRRGRNRGKLAKPARQLVSPTQPRRHSRRYAPTPRAAATALLHTHFPDQFPLMFLFRPVPGLLTIH